MCQPKGFVSIQDAQSARDIKSRNKLPECGGRKRNGETGTRNEKRCGHRGSSWPARGSGRRSLQRLGHRSGTLSKLWGFERWQIVRKSRYVVEIFLEFLNTGTWCNHDTMALGTSANMPQIRTTVGDLFIHRTLLANDSKLLLQRLTDRFVN